MQRIASRFQDSEGTKSKDISLLENAHKGNIHSFDRAFLEQKKGIDTRLENSGIIMTLLAKMKPNEFSIQERKALSLHLEFLTLFEGFFATQINFLIFALIANGCKFYSSLKRKNIEFLNDIEGEPLKIRIKFLRQHGFKTLITGKIGVELRNSVAHLFYEIEDDGTVKIGRRRISENTYTKLYDNLRDISQSLHFIAALFYQRYASMPTTEFEEIKCACGYVNLIAKNRTVLGPEPLTCTKCKKYLAEPKWILKT